MSLHRKNKKLCAEPNRADIKRNRLSHLYGEEREKYKMADDQKNKTVNLRQTITTIVYNVLLKCSFSLNVQILDCLAQIKNGQFHNMTSDTNFTNFSNHFTVFFYVIRLWELALGYDIKFI